jgi:hypothetical protein
MNFTQPNYIHKQLPTKETVATIACSSNVEPETKKKAYSTMYPKYMHKYTIKKNHDRK